MKKPAVIKAEVAARPLSLGLRTFHFDDLAHEAQEMARTAGDTVAAAREQAAAVIAEATAEAEAIQRRAQLEVQALRELARRDVDAIREKARQEGLRLGHDEGFRKGVEAGRAEALVTAQKEFAQAQAGLVSAFRAGIETIDRGQAEWQAVARRDLAELALAIARRVARHVGEREREVILANLEEAIRLVGTRSDVTIAVNPIDAEAARVFAQSLLDLKEHWEHVKVVEESEVTPGGCRVQWGSGSVDATLETQLDRIEMELKGE